MCKKINDERERESDIYPLCALGQVPASAKTQILQITNDKNRYIQIKKFKI